MSRKKVSIEDRFMSVVNEIGIDKAKWAIRILEKLQLSAFVVAPPKVASAPKAKVNNPDLVALKEDICRTCLEGDLDHLSDGQWKSYAEINREKSAAALKKFFSSL
jgi:hypothetical protein